MIHARAHFPDLEGARVEMLGSFEAGDDFDGNGDLKTTVTANSNMVPNDKDNFQIPLTLPMLQDAEIDIMTFSSEFLPFSTAKDKSLKFL
jgi:hypothetical protein